MITGWVYIAIAAPKILSMNISNLRHHSALIFPFFISIIFFAWGLWLIYTLDYFEFDPDEGINLIKALLMHHSYQLYGEIWSDQPPLLTQILAWVFNVFEPNINFARILILVFSTVLLWQFCYILLSLGGTIHVLVGSLFLLISPNYLKLSISVMIGLPSLALAMAAILTIILWHQQKQSKLLIASALFLSLSISIKLFTIFLAPIIVIGIIIDQVADDKINWQQKLQPLVLWTGIFIGFTGLVLIVFVGYDNWHLLINNHTSAKAIAEFQDISLADALKSNYRLFLFGLSFLGIWFAYQQKQWHIFYFVAWMLVSYLLLRQHRPVWYHQALLIQIPALVLVSYALGEIINKLWQEQSKSKIVLTTFSLIIFILSILLIGEQTQTIIKDINSWNSDQQEFSTNLDRQFLAEILKFKSTTKWIVTDSPIFAFRANIPVPPATAVLSWKQVATGNITEDQLIDIIKKYQPEQIFFKRFEWSKVTKFLNQNYQLTKQAENLKLYRRAL